MKVQIHIDRLVIDRGVAESRGRPAVQQQVSQALRQRIVGAVPKEMAADAGAGLESAIGAALSQALARSRQP